MNLRHAACSLVVLTVLCGHALAAPAPEQPATPAPDAEAQYTRDITKRADDAVAALKLDDAARAERVRDLIVNQYRSLRARHDARDAKLKGVPRDDKEQVAKVKAEADAAIKPLHDTFVAKLAADLSPEQVETVKDGMTMNKVNVDYNAFRDMLPDLTDAQKGHILTQLKEAREIAMDMGSAKEKHDVFGKYRGRINNYLAKEGYDLKKASKEWADRRKARDAQAKQAAATQPAN